MSTTDVVIPAHNEGANIAAVVAACRNAEGAGAVIVVANGCTDDTANLAAGAGALVLTCTEPDKGSALMHGLHYVSTERVLFCDADLLGLTTDHVYLMFTLPPLDGQLCGLVDTPAVGLTRLLPPITGQRRLPTALARTLPLAGSGYEAELRIDAALGKRGTPHRTAVLVGVTNPTNAAASPWRFARMVGSVAAASVYLAPELAAYERHGLG